MTSVLPDTLVEGRFQLLEVIGEGGMATVYRAFDQRLRRSLAIKVLSPALAGRPSLRHRFLGEARAMARLTDPRIVRVLDMGEDGERAYIIMELVEGGSLLERVRDYGPLPPRMAARVTLEICEALQYAHDEKVIHRDIKPHNILLTRSGEIRITDFGIAQVQDDDGQQMTKTGAVMGTWGFMAPEQKSDARKVDHRADIYSVGATLWSLLLGQTPPELFMGDTETHMFDGVPEELGAVVRRATRYRRDDRYSSAREMANSIRALLTLMAEDPPDGPPLVPERPAPASVPPVSTMVQLGGEDSLSPSDSRSGPPDPTTVPRPNDGVGMPRREATILPSETMVAPEAGDAEDSTTFPHPMAEPLSSPNLRNERPAYLPPPASQAPASATTRWAVMGGLAAVMAVAIAAVFSWLASHDGPRQVSIEPVGTPEAAETLAAPDPVPPGTTPAGAVPTDAPPTDTPPATVPVDVAPPGVGAPPGDATPASAPTSGARPADSHTSPATSTATPATTPATTTTAPATTPATPTEPAPPVEAAPAVVDAAPAPAPAVDTRSTLEHVSPGVATIGQDLTLTATGPADWKVNLYYRPAGEATFQQKAMVSNNGVYTTTLKIDASMAGGLEYFLEATHEGRDRLRAGKYSSPYRLTVNP